MRMTHDGHLLRMPEGGVHALTDAITAERDLFVVTHMGLAEIEPDSWFLEIVGLVRAPIRLSLPDLMAMKRHEVVSVHECAGSPLTPLEPKRRVGNVVWSGVRLADVLALVGVRAEARYVWSEGLEWGSFAGLVDEPFVKDLPIEKARAPEVLLAVALNGEALRPDRGGPVRLVVPGWYGTNSVKWLGRMTLAAGRAPGPFTTRFYNDAAAGGLRPVWGIAPESIIVRPDPAAPPRAEVASRIEGWAWAENGAALVEVSVNGGVRWEEASLEAGDGFGWRRFSFDFMPMAGVHRLLCRCTDRRGAVQPADGARNAVHAVEIVIG